MSLAVCEFCDKAFNSYGSKICGDCGKELDDAYNKVRRYLYQQPEKADFLAIIEGTGISEKELNYLIKKGRVEIVDRSPKSARCRLCGGETKYGTLCEACAARMLKEQLTKSEERRKELARQQGESRRAARDEAPRERNKWPPRADDECEEERKRTIPISYKTSTDKKCK
jgi:predicted amidophosphoribosyltransferase